MCLVSSFYQCTCSVNLYLLSSLSFAAPHTMTLALKPLPQPSLKTQFVSAALSLTVLWGVSWPPACFQHMPIVSHFLTSPCCSYYLEYHGPPTDCRNLSPSQAALKQPPLNENPSTEPMCGHFHLVSLGHLGWTLSQPSSKQPALCGPCVAGDSMPAPSL